MRLLRSLFVTAAAVVAAVVLAQPVGYAAKDIRINAGVLVVPQPSVVGSANLLPHVWGNLDSAVGIKPAAWRLDNPLGVTVMTVEANTRWSGGGPKNVGVPLKKSDAAYWEVALDSVSDENLANFDVLFWGLGTNNSQISARGREKLNRFLAKGGVLWVDASATIDAGNGLPQGFQIQADATNQVLNALHPLANTPNRLRAREVSAMSVLGGGSLRGLVAGDFGVATNLFGGYLQSSSRWDPMVASGLGFTISVAKSGDGFIVVTTRGVGLALNGPGNANFVSTGINNSESFLSAAKFAVNLISLPQNSLSVGAGGRNDNSVPNEVGAPAIRRFSAPNPIVGSDILSGNMSDTATPAIYNGRVVVSVGNVLRVYDAKTNNDLDGDDNPDDGLVDPLGSPSDLIWQSGALGTRISSPTVIEVAGVAAVEQVWVRDQAGTVYGFDLSSGAPLATVAPPANGATSANDVLPLTAYGDLLFVTNLQTDGTGQVWALDPRTGSILNTGIGPWALFGTSAIFRPSGAVTIGSVPSDDNPNGLDIVAYVPSGEVGTVAPRVTSLWLGATSEAATGVNVIGTTVSLQTRAARRQLPIAANGSALAPNIRVRIPSTGAILSTAQLQTYFSGVTINAPQNGRIELQATGSFPAGITDWSEAQFLVDYYFDWGQATANLGTAQSFVRGQITLVDQTTPSRVIMGSPALSPNGFLGVTVSNADTTNNTGAGGTFYILKEKTAGEFLVRTRFDLHDRITSGFLVQGGTPVSYPEAILDQDNLLTAIPFLSVEMGNSKFVGPAAYANGNFYAVAAGVKRIFGTPLYGGSWNPNTGALLAFDAEPGPMELILNAPSLGSSGEELPLTLRTADMVKSNSQSSPSISSTIGRASFEIERIPNSSQVRVIVETLGGTRSNTLSSCLTTNLPVIANWGTSTDLVIEPEGATSRVPVSGQAGGTWNTLRWYTVMNGYTPVGNPVLTGNVLFQSGLSILPSLIASGSFTSNGLLFGVDTDIAPNDLNLVANTERPWQPQYNVITGVTVPFGFNTARPGNSILWPQFNGIENGDDFRIRLLQASLVGDQMLGLEAGDGVIAVTNGGAFTAGLNVFSKSDFVVVDSQRASRFDPTGSPLWSTQESLYAGPGLPLTAATNRRPLSEPTRMYPDGDNGYVMVDPGNNSVTRVDAAGREVRSIDSIKISPWFRPDGATVSEPRDLRRPHDVKFWTTFKTAAQVQAQFPGEVKLNGPSDERWEHWLIADTGNNRVIEVIDRYRINAAGLQTGLVFYEDENGEYIQGGSRFSSAEGVMIWHTPSELTGKNFAYSSLDRQRYATNTVYAFGFNNVEPGRTSVGLDTAGPTVDRDNPMGYGGVILFDNNARVVLTEFWVPTIPSNVLLGDNGSGGFEFNLPVNPRAEREVKVAGLRSVTVKPVLNGPNVEYLVMIAMQSGVYELRYVDDLRPGAAAGAKRWVAQWMLTNEVYAGMRRPRSTAVFSPASLNGNPSGFKPMYARRLDSGDVLLVNGFAGGYRFSPATRPFNGEVILVDGTIIPDGALGAVGVNDPGYNVNRVNFGFNALSVTFELPPVRGIRGIVNPVFAERQ